MLFSTTTKVATVLALVAAVSAEPSKLCQGNFVVNPEHCSKFEFEKLTSNGQCTDSNNATSGEFHGIELTNCTTFYDISMLPSQNISARASKMAELITNVFENGDTQIGYGYVEKLGDCRGYTCGYIGFTTGTNDAYAVVKEYVKRSPSAPIAKYLPELARLSGFLFGDPERDNTNNLVGYPEAWQNATCTDPIFTRVQLDVGESMYLKPGLKYAASVNVTSNLGKAIFYDTIVQHGWQYVEPYINLPRIIQLTGPRKQGESEQSYLTRFLTTRRQLVCCFPGDVWNDSATRNADLQTLVNNWSRNKDLANPLTLKLFGVSITGNESLLVDTRNCPNQKPPATPPTAIELPIPSCPAKK